MSNDRGNEQSTAGLGGWMTSAEACAALGIKPRALRYRAETGTVERRRLGRKTLYALAGTPGPTEATERNRGNGAIEHLPQLRLVQHRGNGSPAAIATAPLASPEAALDPDLVPRLVAQLTAELSKAREERGEALALGFALAEQRDTLAGELEAVKARLSTMAAELRALPWYAPRRRDKVLADMAALAKP